MLKETAEKKADVNVGGRMATGRGTLKRCKLTKVQEGKV